MGAYLGKGTYWRCLHKFDCRETNLSNTANHFKIFLIEFEICLYEHLYFLYIMNPLFPIVVFISMLWQLKVNMFYPNNSFPDCIKLHKVQELLIGVLVPLTVCSIDKTNIFCTLSMKNIFFILDILFSVTMVTC